MANWRFWPDSLGSVGGRPSSHPVLYALALLIRAVFSSLQR